MIEKPDPWRVPLAVAQIPDTGLHRDLEANQAICAGIADVGGLRDYISPPRNGLLVPKGSRAELASALSMYLNDPARAAETGRINREDAVARFSWSASASRMLAVYERIIRAYRRRAPHSVPVPA